MSRTYYRVYPAYWSDEQVVRWSDDAKLLALYILAGPHRTLEGLFRLPRGYILADLGWTRAKLDPAFDRLLSDGFIEYDEEMELCLIVNALDYQAPENPNQIKHGISLLSELPDSRLFGRLLLLADHYCVPLAEQLREQLPQRLLEGFGKPPSPSPSLSPPQHISVESPGDSTAGSSSRIASRMGNKARIPRRGAREEQASLFDKTDDEAEREETAQRAAKQQAKKKRLRDARAKERAQEQAVFDAWLEATKRTARTIFDPRRRAAIRNGLKHYSLEDCILIVQGCAESDFHMGRDPQAEGKRYDDLDLIFRDAQHMEKFLLLGRNASGKVSRLDYLRGLREHLEDAAVKAMCKPGEWEEVAADD